MRPFAATCQVTVVLVAFAAMANAQFEQRGSVSNPYPGQIASGDFRGDGKLDVATVGFFDSDVSVLLGNGNGTFRLPVLYAAGNEPVSIAAADLNHDGKLDLVVGNYLSDNVSVLLGNGDGTFQPPVNYIIPDNLGSAIYVGVGDFNNDGNPDIVAIDEGRCSTGTINCIVIFLGNGDGTFRIQSVNTTTDWQLSWFAIGDFNKDGILDLAVMESSGFSGGMQIFLGNGDGTFRLGANYPPHEGPVLTARLTKSGNLDLLVASGGLEVFLGNGDGTFRGPTTYPPLVDYFVVADFNGDGIPDAVAMPFSGTQGVLFYGNGDGTFQPATYFGVSGETGFIGEGDFNGDHVPDIVFTNGKNPSYHLITMLNTGVVKFSPTTPLNFKKVKVGTTSAPLTVTLANTGKSALTISSMKTTGQFAMTSTCGSSVPAGANCSISVTFSPTSTGPKSGTVTINDSASSKPQVIELSGSGD